MTITLGWWLLPLALTGAAWFLIYRVLMRGLYRGDYGAGGLAELLRLAAFLICALIIWLVWALLT